MSSQWILLLLFCLSGCISPPKSLAYREFYQHLKRQQVKDRPTTSSDYYLVIFVDARHLDYTHGGTLLNSLAKHPLNGRQTQDVGHAWILLHGPNFSVEGGHSGELGYLQPRYVDGIWDLIECGDPNPVRSLWEVQKDGFFEVGSGGHAPTYAAKVNLTKKQFEAVLGFIDPNHYDYGNYSLVDSQCASFVARIAEIVGLDLESEITISIPKRIRMKKRVYTLWEDPSYSRITISTPDILEKSLMQVNLGWPRKAKVKAPTRR